MSQFFINSNGGGGGAITSVVGQSSLVAPTTTVTTVGSTATVENRAWETQYVVDTSTTQGLRGTFSTIQSAINQAVSDGAALGTYKKIYIRTGTYNESLVIPAGIMLVGEVIPQPVGGPITPYQATVVNGNHTFTGNAVCSFKDINFVTTTGDVFSPGAAALCLLYFEGCVLGSLSGGLITGILPSNSYASYSNCTFTGAGDTTAFSFSGTDSKFSDCTFAQPLNVTVDLNTVVFLNTEGIGLVTLTNGADIEAYDCTFVLSGVHNYNIDASVSGDSGLIRNCYFENATVAGISSAFTGDPWIIQNSGTGSLAGSEINLYADTCNVNSFANSVQGNLIKTTRTATNLNILSSMQYTGVTSTAAARTLTLPDGTGGDTSQKDQIFTVKDESGAAGTNNITITTQGGTKTIDGATSVVINNNYGSLSFIYDGTNYFIL